MSSATTTTRLESADGQTRFITANKEASWRCVKCGCASYSDMSQRELTCAPMEYRSPGRIHITCPRCDFRFAIDALDLEVEGETETGEQRP